MGQSEWPASASLPSGADLSLYLLALGFQLARGSRCLWRALCSYSAQALSAVGPFLPKDPAMMLVVED